VFVPVRQGFRFPPMGDLRREGACAVKSHCSIGPVGKEMRMGRLFYGIDEVLNRPTFPGIKDPTLVHYHFRPARPANLLDSLPHC